ncbi:MAG: hypothetical protein ACI8Y4_002786 [Candidatus Poriferisodalaceae bacterium]|jgi:hypothetical protein
MNTSAGPLFIDLETCCRGPVEFDLGYATSWFSWESGGERSLS